MKPRESDPQTLELRKRFGSRLREERVRLGYTQEEFARIGGVTRRSQILYENGTHSPSVEYVIRLASIGVFTSRLIPSESPPGEADLSALTDEERATLTWETMSLRQLLAGFTRITNRFSQVLDDPDLRHILVRVLMEAIARQHSIETDGDLFEEAESNNVVGQ